MIFQEKNGKITLLIQLTPGASCNKLYFLEKNLWGDILLKASVTSIPEKGKANEALIKLLSTSLQLPKTAFTIKQGTILRLKRIEIDCSGEELEKKFQKISLVK